MASSGSTSEIVEMREELELVHHFNRPDPLRLNLRAAEGKSHGYPVADDLNRLIDATDLRTSPRALGRYRQMGRDLLQKDTLKKPAKVGISQASGIGISESASLKQALRRLCISQASEMAAIKRSSKPIGLSGVSEAGTIKRLYASVVVEASKPGFSLDKEKSTLVEISLVPETITKNSSETATRFCEARNVELSCKSAVYSPRNAISTATNVMQTKIQDVIAAENGVKGTANFKASVSNLRTGAGPSKPSLSPRLIKPVFRSNAFSRKKGKQELVPTLGSSSIIDKVNESGKVPSKTKLGCSKSISPISSRTSPDGAVCNKNKDSGASKAGYSPKCCSDGRTVAVKVNRSSRSRDKGECSQSSKSSLGDYSSGTSISEESNQSGSSGNGSRPHMSKDVRWVAIHHVTTELGSIGLKNFKLLRRLGCGDIGTVYLAELIGGGCLFALKVMDIEFLVSRKKMLRAQTEREILQMLDHPFLPTLYAHFITDNLSFLVMEYCPGGDLHVLRQKQPGRSFPEPAARFYVAEVLLALEYLHMLGVIYRDLKPENILVRQDGHIMLSDFDLSLRCTVSPTLLRSSSLDAEEPLKKLLGPCAESSCINPICLQPSWVQVSCFTPRLLSRSTMSKTRKIKPDLAAQVSPLPQLVVEPTDARSNSFVGTHEYLAPEIIRGDGHGSSVDWWTFGIFLYELLFGRTPFKGPGNEETLANVVAQSLKFPDSPAVSFYAKDLIKGLLIKEPESRLGSVRGAAEIKQHPFFEGLNWALIRCAAPPEVPGNYGAETTLVGASKKKEGKCLDFRTRGENVEFELF